jgi:methylphosphotriester-DNA--protein-cysteine methyltransferase
MQTEIISTSHKIALLLSSNPQLMLKEVARAIAVDRHGIQRAIREECGFSFRHLKKTIRLNYINARLNDVHRNCSIKEIASDIGITPNALSRLVKNATGFYPTKLRRLK